MPKYIRDGELTEKTQTAYLLALKFNLLPGDMRAKAIKALERKIIDNNYNSVNRLCRHRHSESDPERSRS